MMKFLSRLFALLHAVSGLVLLLFSGWFIAACAIAGYDFASVNFNYLLPAVIIRALALTRIATGYAQMWTGHNSLLSHVKKLRLTLFSHLKNKLVLRRAESTEALAKHSESIASLNMAWLTHMLGGIAMVGVASLTLWLWLDEVMWLWGIFICGVAVVFVLGLRAVLQQGERLVALKNQFRHDSEHHIDSASLWHLRENLTHTNMHGIFTALQRQHGVGEYMLWWVQVLAYAVLIGLLCVENLWGQYRGEAVFLVFVLLLLSAKDWLGQVSRSQTAYSDYHESKETFEKLPTQNLPNAVTQPEGAVDSLVLKDFSVENRQVNAIDVTLKNGQVLLLKGGSGCGKTSILQAIAGLLAHTGEKIVNGQTIPVGFVKNWYYADQSPQALSASLSANLRLANPDASDETLVQALEFADLGHLDNLSEWLGNQGRQLSGGELKRLNIARAYLFDASLYLFDEPFEGLDEVKQNTLAKAINQLSQKAPVIVASHIVPSELVVDKVRNL